MKRLSILISIFALLLFSVSCTKNDGYQINGKIDNLNNQKLVLEFLAGEIPIVIDSTQTDENGSFIMKGKITEKGIYRIKASDNKFWLLLLENTNLKFQTDVQNDNFHTIAIENYPAGIQFQKTIEYSIEQQEILMPKYTEYRQKVEDPNIADSIKQEYYENYTIFQTDITTKMTHHINSLLPEYPFSAYFILMKLDPVDHMQFINLKVEEFLTFMPKSTHFLNLKKDMIKVEETISKSIKIK